MVKEATSLNGDTPDVKDLGLGLRGNDKVRV